MILSEKLKELGYNPIQDNFYAYVDVWNSWYKGDVENFHNYTMRNGNATVKKKRRTLGMAKKVCEDWADLLLNEKCKITLEGREEQRLIDAVFTSNNARVKLNEMQELKSACGTVAYIPRVVNQEVDEKGNIRKTKNTNIKIDYVTVDNIHPLTYENGTITECAFSRVVTVGKEQYIYLQIHHRVNGMYEIENRLYKYDNNKIGQEVQPHEVPGFAHVPPIIKTGNDKKQYVIDRLNIVNNIDTTLPLGISVYANAIDILMGIDTAFDSYINEFELAKKRIMVRPSAASYEDGTPVFDANDVTFYPLPEDMNDGEMIKEIDMSLRTDAHNKGIQDFLNMLSAKCGFGENRYKFDNGNISTATQVISENSAMFRTLKKHEIILEDVLIELCRIILRLGNTAMDMKLDEDVEISIDFDDSIIEDKQSDFAKDMQLLSAGIMNDWEFRAKWMNEDEETAKSALPGADELTDEAQNEVE